MVAGAISNLYGNEVEQLLEPKERAILQQNVTPNFEKISTVKWSPLHTVALSMQISCMDKLLENGLAIDSLNKVFVYLLLWWDGATPLHYSVQVGAQQTVKLLIKYKVDVDVVDNEGWTLLHIAIQSRNRDIAKILLVNGADKTRKTKASDLTASIKSILTSFSPSEVDKTAAMLSELAKVVAQEKQLLEEFYDLFQTISILEI